MLQLKDKNKRSSSRNTFVSVVKIIDKGRGYIINEETEDKFYLKRNHVGRALDGDKVKVQLQDTIYSYPKARIIGIKERNRKIFTVRLYRKGNQVLASLYPYQAKKVILKNLDTEIVEFDLAVIEITDWRENHKSAYAKLIKVISNYNDPKSDYEFVTRRNGIHQLKKKAYDSEVNNDFKLTFAIGGGTVSGNAISDADLAETALMLTFNSCHVDIPTHSIEDIVTLETTFMALPTTIELADEVTMVYKGPAAPA